MSAAFDLFLESGSHEQELEAPIDLNKLRRYAWASGDYNPIHYDRAVAEHMGLPGPIVHGMYCMGVLHSSLISLVGPKDYTIKEWDSRFTAMVPIDSRCKVAFKVIAKSDAEIRIEIALCVLGGPEAILACKARVTLLNQKS